jgi:hypothetical protein
MTKKPSKSCKAKVLAVQCRAERAKLRQRLGALVCLRIAASTRNRYALAYARFCAFVSVMGIVLSSIHDLDMATAWYIEHLWQEGEPKPWATDTIAALQYYVPHVKRHVVRCWSMSKALDRLELPCRALPFMPLQVCAFSGGLLRTGYSRFALCCVLGFDILARTGGLLALLVNQVHLDDRINATDAQAVIALIHTKRGRRRGIDESIVVRDATVLRF